MIPLFFSFLQLLIINVDGITMTKMMSKSEYYTGTHVYQQVLSVVMPYVRIRD